MLLISRSRSGYSVGWRNFGDGEKQERWLTGGKRMRQVRNRSREIYGTKKKRNRNLFYTFICILIRFVSHNQLYGTFMKILLSLLEPIVGIYIFYYSSHYTGNKRNRGFRNRKFPSNCRPNYFPVGNSSYWTLFFSKVATGK